MLEADIHSRPLAGVTVLELGTIVAAPFAAQQLAEYGASVVKIESPGGDASRRMGPTTEQGMGPLFLGVNRGKKSVMLDLKTPLGLEAFHRLVSAHDIFIHNIRPHKLARLGLSPEKLLEAYPRLIYAGVHGFRATGPYGEHPAYDDIVQGLSGLASLALKQGAQPRYVPSAIADKNVAQVAVQAILAALYARERTGKGAYVEVPMFETMVSNVLAEHMHARHFLPPLGQAGYDRQLSAVRRPFRTLDGYVCLMPSTDLQWNRFFEANGRSDLRLDARFGDVAARTANVGVLYQWVADVIGLRTTNEWIALLQQLDIPVAPMNQLDDLMDDPHLKATGHFATLQDAGLGAVVFPTNGVRFDGKPNEVRMPPRLGEHTGEVLRAAGMSAGEVDVLVGAAQATQP